MLPVVPGGKKPLVKDWPNQATTDPRRIHMWWSRWPEANIGIPTGKASGIVSVDLDVYKAGAWNQGDAEREKGPLPDTATIATGRGGLQLWYRHPEGEELPGSPENTIGPGFCVKSGGGYVVAPPSATTGRYSTVLRMEPSEMPAWLVEELGKSAASRRLGERSGRRPKTPVGDTIPEGSRNAELTSIAGRLHDSTRDLAQLTEDLLRVRDERCEEPEGFPDAEVEKISRWVHRQEPCKPERKTDPERDGLVEALGRAWFEDPAEGIGGKTDSSIERVLIREGARVGTVMPGVGLRVSISVRDVAEEAKCHPNTVINYTKRAREAGRLRKDEATVRGQSGAFVLLDPRLGCDTLNNVPASRGGKVVGVSQRSHATASQLRTEHYRWRGLVGKGRERALCFLEAFGPMSAKELACRLGWSRGGDVRRRYLEPLVGLGLVEDRAGVYALAGDHRERSGDLREEPYSTEQLRVRRVRSEEGLWVHVVAESGMVASEAERNVLDRDRHARQREAYRLRLVQESPEAEEECRELLNAWDEEREAPAGEIPVVDGEISELEKVEPPDPDTIRSEVEVFEIARTMLAGIGSAA